MDANTYWLPSSSGVDGTMQGNAGPNQNEGHKVKETDLSIVNPPGMLNFTSIFAGATAAVASSAAVAHPDALNGGKNFMVGGPSGVPSLNQITIPSANQLSKRSGVFPISGTLPGMATISNIGMQNANVIISANAPINNLQQVAVTQLPFTSAAQIPTSIAKDFIQQAAAESGVSMVANADASVALMQTNVFPLQQHQQQHVATPIPQSPSASEEQPLKCSQCNKTFKQAGQLSYHAFVAHAELQARPHKCASCPESFLAAHHLQDHVKAVHLSNDGHQNNTTYTCSECNASFTNGGQLNYHIYMAHTVQGPPIVQHMCTHCGKNFMKSSLLAAHIRNVHGAVAGNPVANTTLNTVNNNTNTVVTTSHNQTEMNDNSEKPLQCKDCDKTFKNTSYLKQHLLSVHNKPHKCEECGKGFGRRSDLNRHMRGVHMRERPHHCNKCGWTFAEAGNLKHHMQAVHSKQKNYHCQVCSKSFSILSYLKTHMVRVHNITDSVKNTATTMVTTDSMVNNNNQQQQQQQVFTVQETQSTEINQIHLPTPQSHMNRCYECGQVFSSVVMLQNHVMSTHPQPFWCTVCGEGFSQAYQLQYHLQARHSNNASTAPVMINQSNNQEVARATPMSTNMIEQTTEDLQGMVTTKCHACGEFFDKSSNKDHVCPSLKQAALTAAAAMALAGERPHLCTKCGKGFKTATHLKQHVRCVHTNDRPHKCYQCGKTFARMSDLNRHVKGVHQRQKVPSKSLRLLSLKCSECGSGFSETTQLKRHILTVHLHQRPCFKCADCQEGFADEHAFKNHICHEEERPHVCNVCSKRFSEATQLRRHLRSAHTNQGAQPQHHCHQCGRSFTRPVDLARHIHAVHLKERPHKCDICGKSFGLHGNLNKHVRAVHMLEKPHQCVECGKCFAHIGVLKRHLRDIHFYDKRPGKFSKVAAQDVQMDASSNEQQQQSQQEQQPITQLSVLQAIEAIQQEQQHMLQGTHTSNGGSHQQTPGSNMHPHQVVPASPQLMTGPIAPAPTPTPPETAR